MKDLNPIVDEALREALDTYQLGSAEQRVPFVVAAVLSALRPQIEQAARAAFGLVGGAA